MKHLMLWLCLTFSCLGVLSSQNDSLLIVLDKALKEQIDLFGPEHLNVAVYSDSLGKVLLDKNEYEQAENLFAQSLDIKRKYFEEQHIDIAKTHYNLGEVYLETRKYARAIDHHTKALQIRLEVLGLLESEVEKSYSSLARSYFLNSDYENAVTYHKKALDVCLNIYGEYDDNVILSLTNLGDVHDMMGEYENAIDYFNRALHISLEIFGQKHYQVAKIYSSLAIEYDRSGKYHKALNFHKKALEIQLELSDENSDEVATYYNSLSIGYYRIANFEKSFEYLEKAIRIWIELFGEKNSRIALSYNNLGNLYRIKSNHDQAIKFYNKALNIQLELFGKYNSDTANSYYNLGIIYDDIGDYEKAIHLHNIAIESRLKLFKETHPYLAMSYSNLGNIHKKKGEYEEATTLFYKALNIQIDALDKNHPHTADTYYSLGSVYQNKENYTKAIEYFNKALSILEVLGNSHSSVANGYSNLGSVYRKIGDLKKATDYYTKALNSMLNIFGNNNPNVASSYYNLAASYELEGQIEKSDSLWQISIPLITKQLKSTYSFLPEAKRLKYLNTITETNVDFISFSALYGSESTKQLATDYLLNTKSLALDYSISANQLIKEIRDSTLNNQYKELKNLNKKLADAETLTKTELEEKNWNLSELQERQDDIAFKMHQHSILKSKLNNITTHWQDIQNKLNSTEATVDFIEVNNKKDTTSLFYAVVIRNDNQNPQFVRLCNKENIINLLHVDDKERPKYLMDLNGRKALYNSLWLPLEPYLDKINKIHLSPSDILHRIPFESFQDEDDEYLATQYEFHYYSSLRDIFKNQTSTFTYNDIVLVGHILYDLEKKSEYQEEILALGDNYRSTRSGIKPLAKTLKEVININRISDAAGLSTTLLTIDAASEDTIQYFIKDRAPSIYHFATHGVFLPSLELENQKRFKGKRDRLRAAKNPLQRSALLLYGANETWTKGRKILGSGEDGILTALEVASLDLQNTNLVVLSACSTGLGNIHNTEGVFGLQRAFKLAGVNSVIASLWDVDDEATKDLMILFYNNLLLKKQDIATALRLAKLDMKQKGAKPEHWAGFLLIE